MCELCEALKNGAIQRLDIYLVGSPLLDNVEHRWLAWDRKWVVYQQLPYAKSATVVLETDDLQAAVVKLAHGR